LKGILHEACERLRNFSLLGNLLCLNVTYCFLHSGHKIIIKPSTSDYISLTVFTLDPYTYIEESSLIN